MPGHGTSSIPAGWAGASIQAGLHQPWQVHKSTGSPAASRVIAENNFQNRGRRSVQDEARAAAHPRSGLRKASNIVAAWRSFQKPHSEYDPSGTRCLRVQTLFSALPVSLRIRSSTCGLVRTPHSPLPFGNDFRQSLWRHIHCIRIHSCSTLSACTAFGSSVP